jgi:hypothetical protein
MILRMFNDAVSTVDFTEDLIGLKDNSGRWIGKDLEDIGCEVFEGVRLGGGVLRKVVKSIVRIIGNPNEIRSGWNTDL